MVIHVEHDYYYNLKNNIYIYIIQYLNFIIKMTKV